MVENGGIVKIRIFALAAAGVVAGEPASALETQTRSMSYEQCLATIRQVSSELGVAPINIVETNIMRMVRFPTEDGSVLITCSAPDQKMVVTKSD